MDLKETLQHYRKQQGLSQIDLADALEVSRQTVSKWETGAALPSAENLLALSKLYGVSVDVLLSNTEEGAALESLPLPEAFPAAPAAERPTGPSRRKLILQILAAVLVCDVVAFLMDISLYSNGGEPGFHYFAQIFRISSCLAIGLFFAWWDRLSPVNRKASLLIAGAALALALYPFLFFPSFLWRLYDFIVWRGLYTPDAVSPYYGPVRTFIAWTLCDTFAFTCHMGLITVFQLSRLGFSRGRSFAVRPQLAPHA